MKIVKIFQQEKDILYCQSLVLQIAGLLVLLFLGVFLENPNKHVIYILGGLSSGVIVFVLFGKKWRRLCGYID